MINKITAIIFLTVCLCGMLCAEPWTYTTDVSLGLTQNAYSDNWGGTELSNINWVASSNSTAEKQLNSFLLDKTTLKLAFGQTHSQKVNAMGEKYWATPDKTTDKIDLESVLKFTLHTYVDPFISARMESQFLDLSDAGKTRNFNPIKLTEGAGIARTFIKDETAELGARLGASFRQNMDREWLNPVNLKRETYTTNDGGLEFVAEFSKNFAPKDMTFKSKMLVFQALFNSKEAELPNDYWKTADMKWENTLSTKLISVITMSLYFELLYEKEQDKDLQFKETLALGVSYRLF